MDDRNKIEFLSNNFDNIQNLISLADSKANTSLTIQTFIIGFILGSSFLTNLFDSLQLLDKGFIYYSFYFFLSLFIISSIVGIIYCILIFKARFPAEKSEINRSGVFYFNHIKEFKSSNEYMKEIMGLDDKRWLEELTKQVYNISHIVSDKMKYVNTAISYLIINIILGIIISFYAIFILSNIPGC